MKEVWNTEKWSGAFRYWSIVGRSATQPDAQSYAKHLCDKDQVITRVTNPEGTEVCCYYPEWQEPKQKRTHGPAWFLGQT